MRPSPHRVPDALHTTLSRSRHCQWHVDPCHPEDPKAPCCNHESQIGGVTGACPARHKISLGTMNRHMLPAWITGGMGYILSRGALAALGPEVCLLCMAP